MIDIFEPLEEGLDTVTSRRYVSCMKITLSTNKEDVDMSAAGYQPPLPNSELHPTAERFSSNASMMREITST